MTREFTEPEVCRGNLPQSHCRGRRVDGCNCRLSYGTVEYERNAEIMVQLGLTLHVEHRSCHTNFVVSVIVYGILEQNPPV